MDCAGVGAREAIEPADLSDDLRRDGDPDAENRSASENGKENEMLVFRTGWDAHWGTDRYYDHPYLSRRVAAWCAERGYHVGLDALSPDPSPSEDGKDAESACEEGEKGKSPSERERESNAEPDGVPAHRELLGSERFVLENLTGLADLPARFELRARPLALAGSDGSPVRAVATW